MIKHVREYCNTQTNKMLPGEPVLSRATCVGEFFHLECVSFQLHNKLSPKKKKMESTDQNNANDSKGERRELINDEE